MGTHLGDGCWPPLLTGCQEVPAGAGASECCSVPLLARLAPAVEDCVSAHPTSQTEQQADLACKQRATGTQKCRIWALSVSRSPTASAALLSAGALAAVVQRIGAGSARECSGTGDCRRVSAEHGGGGNAAAGPSGKAAAGGSWGFARRHAGAWK